MHQSQQQKHQQKQGYYLSQHHLKLMHLMHLSGYALNEFLAIEVEQNPALEVEVEGQDDEPENAEEDNVFDPELFENDDDLFEKKQNTAAQEFYEAPVVHYNSLSDNLKEQIHHMHLTDEVNAMACFIIDELDDDGYLRIPIKDVSDDYSFARGKLIEDHISEKGLHAVQLCEPSGIAARDLKECLLLQLTRRLKIDKNSNIQVAIDILENHYELFEQRNFIQLKSNLTIDDKQWDDVIQILTKLNPKPVTEANKYELMKEQIIPDFEVTLEEDELYVSLTQSDAVKLKVNADFNKAPFKHSEAEKKQAEHFFAKMVEDAQLLVGALKERENSMRKIITVITGMQPKFFRTGDLKDLKPMILQDIAAITKFDISTVSRVTSNKYVQTPQGMFALKNLFMRNINPHEDANSQHTAVGIQDEIKKFTEMEDKKSPFSDSEIAKLLNDKGINIARRTVVKYREALAIPNSTVRKNK